MLLSFSTVVLWDDSDHGPLDNLLSVEFCQNIAELLFYALL